MRRNKIFSRFISLFFAAVLLISFSFFGNKVEPLLTNASANITLTEENYKNAGASIRVANDGKNGIRFHVLMERTAYETLSADPSFKTETLICPTTLLGDSELTTSNPNVLSVDTTSVWRDYAKDSAYVETVAYVYGMPDTKYATQMSFRGIVTTSSQIWMTETDMRSIAYVAKAAKEDGDLRTELDDYIPDYTIQYLDSNGNEISTETVEYGNKATQTPTEGISSWRRNGEPFYLSSLVFDMENYTDTIVLTSIADTVLKTFNDENAWALRSLLSTPEYIAATEIIFETEYGMIHRRGCTAADLLANSKSFYCVNEYDESRVVSIENVKLYWKGSVLYIYNADSLTDGELTTEAISISDITQLFATSYYDDNYNLINNNLVNVEMQYLDTTGITSIYGLFSDCVKFEDFDYNFLFSQLDMSQVTNIGALFSGCTSLKEVNFEGADLSNVDTIRYMFSGCTSLVEADLSDLNFSKVTSATNLFWDCTSLKKVKFFADLGSQTEGLSLSSVFDGCTALETVDMSESNLSKITSLSMAFSGCSSLKTVLFPEDLSSLTSIRMIFEDCIALTSVDMSAFKSAKLTDMAYAFENCSSLKSLDFSSLDLSNVTTLSQMCKKCTSLESVKMGTQTMSALTNLSYMFDGCTALQTADFSKVQTTTALTSLSYMFNKCSSLKTLDLSLFNTASVKSMGSTFNSCSSLTTIYVGPTWSIASVTSGSSCFYNCTSLKGAISYNKNYTKCTYATTSYYMTLKG